MAVTPRLLFFTAIVAAPALLITGCGDDADGARTTIAEVQSTSYVVQDPVTTTTTTTTTAPQTGIPGETVPGEQSYTVQSGDSVFKIASLHGIEPDVLSNYNSWPEGINHPVFVGDIIKIPPGSQVPGSGDDGSSDAVTDSSATDTSPDTAGTTAAPGGVGCQHTVVAGDNPSVLAGQYDVTLDELNAVNADNPAYSHFQLGSQINIPANGTC